MTHQFIRNKTKEQPVSVKITDGTRFDKVTIYPGVAKIPEGWSVVKSEFTRLPAIKDETTLWATKKAREGEARARHLNRQKQRRETEAARRRTARTSVRKMAEDAEESVQSPGLNTGGGVSLTVTAN